jgi:hypothetical protein
LHPAVTHVLRFFEYRHFPAYFQEVARPFAELAGRVAEWAPDNQETTVALRDLLSSRDAALRAAIPPEPKPQTMWDADATECTTETARDRVE